MTGGAIFDPGESDEQLVLADLLNHVLDRGVVITGEVTISVADIDLVKVGLSLMIAAVETTEVVQRRALLKRQQNADVSLLPRRP
ncbi:MAG: gas vesicle protein [Gemmatimonadota bacterium]|nr:gas vesicle protein [Gemmatimonadota bacterium]